MILTRLTRWALRAAARRWPADLREELYREWQAELAYLERQPRTAGRRLGFAFSLLTSPPVHDAAGVPRGWAEARTGLNPAAALIIAALFGLGVLSFARSLLFPVLDILGVDDFGWLWPRGEEIINAAVLILWCVPVAWWLGHRLPMARDGRLGPSGPAVLAPLAALPALLVPASDGEGLLPSLVTVLALTTWAVLTALLGRAVARSAAAASAEPFAGASSAGAVPAAPAAAGGSRGARLSRGGALALVLAGVPLVAVVAALTATIPVLINRGGDAAVASLLLGDPDLLLREGEYGLIVYTGGYIGQLIAYGWFAVLYGRRAATAPDRQIRMTESDLAATDLAATDLSATDPSSAHPSSAGASSLSGSGSSSLSGPGTSADGTSAGFSPVILGAGLTAVLAGALTWAYTVTILTPAMPVMASQAPMPGGDGEIYLWVAELRWTAILLAALGMLVATANRRSAPRASILLAAGLLGTESAMLAGGPAGATGLRIALLVAAAVIAGSWALAGPASAPRTVIRFRTTAVSIAATAFGPLLYGQSTPGENHEFMPLGLPLTTAAIAIGLVLLGTVTGAATSRPHPHPAVTALLVTVPTGILAGLAVLLGNGSDESLAGLGILLGLPLAVVMTALLRRHRPRRRGRTALIWTLLTLAAIPATAAVLYMAVMLLSFVPTILFLVDGTSYPADGISVVPGTVLLLLPAATWVAARSDGTPPKTAQPTPNPHPDPAPRPGSAPSPDPAPSPGPAPNLDTPSDPDPASGSDAAPGSDPASGSGPTPGAARMSGPALAPELDRSPGPAPTSELDPLPGPAPTSDLDPLPGPAPTPVLDPLPGPAPTSSPGQGTLPASSPLPTRTRA